MSKFYFNLKNEKIPLITTGTSPFIGAGQFGTKGAQWRRKFLDDTEAMVEILEAAYQEGSKGIEVIPIGKILDAAKMMGDTHSDYVITGSTYPGKNSGIDKLVDVGAKLIFVHAFIADNKNKKLDRLLNQVEFQGAIPGIATHDPINTIKYCLENNVNVKAFLVPFNDRGLYMEDKTELENLVDKTKNYDFIAMKTLAAGRITPETAFNYIARHNISAVTVGMVSIKEAKETTNIALDFLNKKK
ncbi:MAG: hypothetical protein GF383_08895 [Candidatus Lokiarchaeota archaeon]|nr:hypothetical protein [Candidatus Lokiarchaeota archaeon]MBD3340504.1 hypothetical protein [Candidatus Lokiarchaeota archaeon]